MGFPTVHGSAVAVVMLFAACETPQSPGDVSPSLQVTGNQLVIHVDDDAAPGGNGSGRFPYNNLPEAVAAAHATSAAVLIKVEPGDYPLPEPLVIDRPLDLRGSTRQVESDDAWPTGESAPGTKTRILATNALGSEPLIAVGRADGAVLNGVRISGFVLEGTATGTEVLLTRVQDYLVADNVFRAPATNGMLSIASSGRVTGNHFSGVGAGAIFDGGYPASPSTVEFTGNRSVRNRNGGVVLVGGSVDIPEIGDELHATVRDNDLSDNSLNPNQGFGLRVFILPPLSALSSGRVHALAQGNRVAGNRMGISIDAGFPYRRVGAVCDTRVYWGAIDLRLSGNTVTGSLLTPALITFTRHAAALNPTMLSEWQYLHGASFVISDNDGTLADALIDHPESDPLLGQCPGDAAHEPLRNTLLYNGAVMPNGRNF